MWEGFIWLKCSFGNEPIFQFSSVQSVSRVWLFATPWITARQASLSITLVTCIPCFSCSSNHTWKTFSYTILFGNYHSYNWCVKLIRDMYDLFAKDSSYLWYFHIGSKCFSVQYPITEFCQQLLLIFGSLGKLEEISK